MQDRRAWADAVAMELAAAYERERGWEAADVSEGFGPAWATEAVTARDPRIHLRHMDYVSRDSTHEHYRFVEVKSRSTSGPVDINGRQRSAFESLGDEAWLYVVFNCRAAWDQAVTDPYLIAVAEPRRLPWYEAPGGGWQVTSETVVEAGERVFSRPPSAATMRR